MIDDLLALLRRSGLVRDTEGLEISLLSGGFWNDLFRIQDRDRDWVVKRFRTSSEGGLYPILPRSEALALDVLRGLAIAPEPIAFIEDEAWRVLVYHFVAGTTWQDDFEGVARLLGRLHRVEIDPERDFRKLPLDPAAILAQGDQLLAQAREESHVSRLRRHRPDSVARPALDRLSLVHTDAWAGNFIQHGTEARLIDWQCPGLGDPAEDVWTFIASGYEMLLGRERFNLSASEAFLRAYPDRQVIERVLRLSPCFAYRVAAYAILRHQQLASQDPVASANYLRVCEHLMASLRQ